MAEQLSLEGVEETVESGAEDTKPRAYSQAEVDAISATAAQKAAEAVAAQVANLQGQVTAMQATAKQPTVAPPTVEELMAKVDRGDITEAQLAVELAKQTRQALSVETQAQINEALRNQRVSSEVQEYRAARPELMKQGTPERQTLQEKYDWIISTNGRSPVDNAEQIAWELQALKMAFPTVKPLEDRTRRTTHQEGGGSSESGTGSKDRAGGVPAWVPEKLIPHYENQIAAGRYNGWDDPQLVAEKPYMRSN